MRDRDDYVSAGGPATRRGYAERRRSLKAYVSPADFGRSRRVGLSRFVCSRCGAVRGESVCHHGKDCPGHQGFVKQRTGPLAPFGPVIIVKMGESFTSSPETDPTISTGSGWYA